MSDLILAATAWPTNAAMIADVVRLGYLKNTDLILDPTYGEGGWWKTWRPSIGRVEAPLYGGGTLWDFRQMYYQDEVFDAVAFDPPYVSVGGRKTSTVKKFQNRYGMDETPNSPQGVQDDINAGLAECWRVVKRGGIVLVKCQDYVSSGRLYPGTHHTLTAAFALGFQLVDRLEHLGEPGPQSQITQVHARHCHSTLFVLRRPRRG